MKVLVRFYKTEIKAKDSFESNMPIYLKELMNANFSPGICLIETSFQGRSRGYYIVKAHLQSFIPASWLSVDTTCELENYG